MHAKTVTPIEALRIMIDRTERPEPVAGSVDSASGLYLSKGVDLQPQVHNKSAGAVATVNGYAVPVGFSGGSCYFRARALANIGEGESFSGSQHVWGDLPTAVRLETGDPLPPGADRIVPVEKAVVRGSGLLQVDSAHLPPAGFGVENVKSPGAGGRVHAGSQLTPRLQAFLMAGGIDKVEIWPPADIGVATIGNELVDLLALESLPSSAAAEVSTQRRLVGDLTGYWLPRAIGCLGQRPHALGLLPDEPTTILAALRRAQNLGVKKVILVGGVGDGITDRTLEALESGPFHIFFSVLALEPGSRLAFAQGLGMDVLVLGGAPLDAVVAFDLFGAPFLLYVMGASARLWDWTNHGSIESPPTVQRRAGEGGGPWSATPISAGGGVEGSDGRLSRFTPGAPGQTGWRVQSPDGERSYCAKSWI